MENQELFFCINVKDLRDIITYLKDYSETVGKIYNQVHDIPTKQELAIYSLNINKTIKKLEKELMKK